MIDICPVGALTDRDFRFQVRVWYLDTAKSVCNGCARVCNTEVHTSQRRPHHNQGRRIARLKPRLNPEVNRWWLCDEGRYGFGWIDDDTRLVAPARRGPARWSRRRGTTPSPACGGARARPAGGDRRVASPQMSNEDLFALRRVLDDLRSVPRSGCPRASPATRTTC